MDQETLERLDRNPDFQQFREDLLKAFPQNWRNARDWDAITRLKGIHEVLDFIRQPRGLLASDD